MTHDAEVHLSFIRIKKKLAIPYHCLFKKTKNFILLRAEACSLLSITQALHGRLEHVLSWVFTNFIGY